MPKQWKTSQLKKLAQTLTNIDEQTQMLNFLRDLCTIEELHVLSSRWEAVRLLNQGKTYREIAQKTGLSTTTVTRIAHWLKHGEGGYQKSLET